MVKEIGNIRLFSVDDLHEAFGLNKRTIRDYFITGKFKGRKIGTSWYITEENLKLFLNGQEDTTGSEQAKKRGPKPHKG